MIYPIFIPLQNTGYVEPGEGLIILIALHIFFFLMWVVSTSWSLVENRDCLYNFSFFDDNIAQMPSITMLGVLACVDILIGIVCILEAII